MPQSAVFDFRRPLDAVLGLVVFAAGIALCCWWSIVYTRGPLGLSTLWVSSGVLCGYLLTSEPRLWTAYLLTAFSALALVNFLLHGASMIGVELSLAETLDAWLVAWIVSRRASDVTSIASIKRSVLVATTATLLACMVSGLIAAYARSSAAAAPASFEVLFMIWLASHALGMAIFATLTIIARVEGKRLLGQSGRRLELTATLALIAWVSLAVFWRDWIALPFLIYPPLLLCVFRHRFSGFMLGTAIIAVIATMGTAAGHGPFASGGGAHGTSMLQLFIASVCLVAFPMAVALTERKLLTHRIAESEREYRLLADNTSDLIGRVGVDDSQFYISPSVTEMLGWDYQDFRVPRWDLVHPDDAANLRRVFDSVLETGEGATALFRMRHKDGGYPWIEIKFRRAPGEHAGDPAEIIFAGRDVTLRMEAQRALGRNQRRLRAITDNLPAFVLHIDRQQRYTFANAYTGKMLGIEPTSMIGLSVREVMGANIHAELEPYMQAALRGETAVFEIERELQGQRRHYQSTYVPDVAEDDTIAGFYAVTFDITQLKRAEHELLRLARHDPLTGLANRLYFNERIEVAIARNQRHGKPLALLYLDIDHFKRINDTLSHAAGDEVLQEFARRLAHCVRATDFVARLGGDEFVVLVEDIDTPNAPQTIAAKLIALMQSEIRAGGSSLRVTTSIGIALCEHAVSGPKELMQRADTALYAAKATGRNTWQIA